MSNDATDQKPFRTPTGTPSSYRYLYRTGEQVTSGDVVLCDGTRQCSVVGGNGGTKHNPLVLLRPCDLPVTTRMSAAVSRLTRVSAGEGLDTLAKQLSKMKLEEPDPLYNKVFKPVEQLLKPHTELVSRLEWIPAKDDQPARVLLAFSTDASPPSIKEVTDQLSDFPELEFTKSAPAGVLELLSGNTDETMHPYERTDGTVSRTGI
ncbi:hypothetical protein CAOG_01174 [Capsaspora owczarzaki ATCC 30864]|uniref:Uncharacterized protein n=1 Tax=Capsaspora owczarzaki (strain ATCC 30864) TaxID=595528 RepID=A0A0D2X0W0_CAPO3|nr:hypothetical protein CAOG_01174 [Capsaspora owczarzaki ATCC 30864]KJE89744.1 hypothetical protein CAOG_001174 [Capsaspora owczarzaki ATCC 30864]|eukprot:XP_004366045.2 hypothetical protein CAOG_01174 [Capsaspora owczarzaki ATCC 30864]